MNRYEARKADQFDEEMPSQNQKRMIINAVIFGIVWMLATSLFVLALWYHTTFEMEFASLLYTLLSPIKGTGESTVLEILSACVPPAALLWAAYVVVVCFLREPTRACRIARRVGAWFCCASLIFSTVFAVVAFRIPKYLEMTFGRTGLYEEYYIDPNTVKIEDADGVKKNLIYIYLESMETTYASSSVGGMQPENNYIPNLTALANREDTITFSNDEDLGGFHSITGTTWTMGALMSSTSGVPFSKEVFEDSTGNSQGKTGNFANRLTALGDILEEQGYRQEFLCGSDASFAGRDAYFTQHGSYELFDLYTAREEDYIPDDYYVWWGYEDATLFDIAKDEVLELASGDDPFNFTMLTVDTHHVGGYRCSKCSNEYETGLENVIACSDRLVGEFLSWCEQQDFYEDTVIIVTGDHPRMDKQLVEDIDFYDRTIYNCFINSEVTTEHVTGRTFTSMDLFPTILAAMGYTIEGDRLGLGTNLFSNRPTLAEEKGYDWLDDEVGKYSSYYEKNFI